MASNTSFFESDELVSRPKAHVSRPTFYERWIAPLVAAREAKARRLVASHLAAFTDEELTNRLGFDADKVAEIRKAAKQPAPHWL